MLSYFIEYLQKVSNNIGVVPKKKKPPRRRVAVCNIHPPLAESPIPLGSEAAHMPRLPKCARDKEEGSNPIPALSAKEQRRGRTSSRSPCLG